MSLNKRKKTCFVCDPLFAEFEVQRTRRNILEVRGLKDRQHQFVREHLHVPEHLHVHEYLQSEASSSDRFAIGLWGLVCLLLLFDIVRRVVVNCL